jgi:hypothetical protein
MKKILALVFALGTMTAVFAQNGRSRDESRDVILGQGNNKTVYDDRRDEGGYSNRDNNRYDNRYGNTNALEDRIARINRDYDWKIESVQRDRYMKKNEKKRKIRDLENERNDRIREVRQRFNENRNYGNGRRN